MRWLLLSASILLAGTLGAQSADASHQGTSHCIEDPNADQVVDISDIVLFAAAFGDTGPAHLDVAPQMGDGFIDVTDLTYVAGHFGEACYGMTTGSAVQFMSAGASMGVAECEFWLSGWPVGGTAEGIDIEWGAKTECDQISPGQYVTYCYFQIKRWTPDPVGGGYHWELILASPNGYYQQGLYCYTEHIPGYVPRGSDLMGGLWHQIWQNGASVHALSEHTNGYVIEVP